MNWFAGNIAEAVNLSKLRNSVFVVYVEGTDDVSGRITGYLNDEKIRRYLESKHFVAIKIQSGSEAYMQFAQIYQLVPLPSLFFIGKNGSPITIVTGAVSGLNELEEKIQSVLLSINATIESGTSSSISAVTSNFIANETTSSAPVTSQSVTPPPNVSVPTNQPSSSSKPTEEPETEIVCDGDVCYKKPVQTKKEAEPKPEIDVSKENEDAKKKLEEKIELAKKLIEKTRKEKEIEEKEAERQREVRRRKEGQQFRDLKQEMKQKELLELKESYKKEKQQDQAARRRILDQIEQDRLERAEKFVPIPSINNEKDTEKPSTSQSTSTSSSTLSKIQFRKPGGETEMHIFDVSDIFKVVRDYVQQNIVPNTGINEFILATTFPKREFSENDYQTTLKDLGLFPSSVLLIIPIGKTKQSPSDVVSNASRSIYDLVYSIVWNIFTPFIAVYAYARNYWYNRNNTDTGGQKRANEDQPSPNDAAKRRNLSVFEKSTLTKSPKEDKTGAYRRVGDSNIHRLHETQDSDDENNTWNGNSTQQQ